jgi:hypothetical protein
MCIGAMDLKEKLMRLKKVSVILAIAVALIAGPALAETGEGPDVCLDVTFECVDATTFSGPAEFYGTVTNCSDFPLDALYVQNPFTDENYVEPGPLGPGESVMFRYEVPTDPDTCEAYSKVWIRGYAMGWTISERIFLEATCECGPELLAVCRTPGFYGTHAGDAKKNSQNITQQILDAAGGLSVCGEFVDNTALNMDGSALEAMCEKTQGDSRLQLYRHLVAASLNCVMSGAPLDCDDTGIEGLFNECNEACIMNNDADLMESCRYKVDCWNNGGTMLADGMCQLGTCGLGGAPCEETEDCGYDDFGEEVECIPLEGTCHDQLLVNEALGLDFDPPGPAGSSKACNEAIQNDCTFISCN